MSNKLIKENSLKPCPFCGRKVSRIIGIGGINFFSCHSKNGCGAIVSFDNDFYNEHENEAVKAWNRRTCSCKKQEE